MFFGCKTKIKNRGFSLLELLIVITIIGLLSTVVLTSVSRSRAKSYDSKIKQQLTSFRTAAEMYFSNQIPNSYGPDAATCDVGIFNDFTPSNGAPGKYIDPATMPSFTQIFCYTNGQSYSVKATLFSGNEYWCVDSKGASRLEAGVPNGEVICP